MQRDPSQEPLVDMGEREVMSADRLERIRLVAHDLNNLYMVAALFFDPDERLDASDGQMALRELGRLLARLRQLCHEPAPPPRELPLAPLVRTSLGPLLAILPGHVEMRIQVDEVGVARVWPALVDHILRNLVLNAQAACRDGGVITVSLDRAEPAWIRLAVTDTGSGIDDALVARLGHEPVADRAPGHGLGLTLLRKRLERIGGRLEVESEPGVGTRVTAFLRGAD